MLKTTFLKKNTIQSRQEVHVENNPQITQEIKESQNVSQSQNHNESILSDQSHNIEHEETPTANNQKMFNEDIHREEWLEEGEKKHRPPPP